MHYKIYAILYIDNHFDNAEKIIHIFIECIHYLNKLPYKQYKGDEMRRDVFRY